MLKTRVIPVMLWRDFTLVKGERFNSQRRVGSVMQSIKVYSARDVDELIIVDIAASVGNTQPRIGEISAFASDCNVPLTIGGGVRNIQDIESLLQAGADKVSINSAAFTNESLIEYGANIYGSQCIVGSVDYRVIDEKPVCFSNSGTKNEATPLIEWTRKLADLGAGEILLTNCDRDGTMAGYDIERIAEVCDAVRVPVIASGGAGKTEDFVEASRAGAQAVAAGALFHFTHVTPRMIKEAMSLAGVPVRIGI